MAKIGVKDIHVAKLLTDEVSGATYETPVKLKGAMTIGMTPNVASGSLDADDQRWESHDSLTSYEIMMNLADLSAENEALLLGRELDSNGGVISTTEDTAPEFAVMFRAEQSQRAGGGYQYRVAYRVKFRPYDENYQTKGDNVDYQTPTITGTAMARMDGVFDLKLPENETNSAVVAKFFDTVVEPNEVAGP